LPANAAQERFPDPRELGRQLLLTASKSPMRLQGPGATVTVPACTGKASMASRPEIVNEGDKKQSPIPGQPNNKRRLLRLKAFHRPSPDGKGATPLSAKRFVPSMDSQVKKIGVPGE